MTRSRGRRRSALSRTGRIRRNGLRRVPGQSWEDGRSRGSSKPRWHASATGSEQRVDGAGRTDAGVHAYGQVIAFTYDGRLTATELGRALDALLPADVAIRDLRRDAGRVPPPLCGAVPGVPLHRLERAAQPASRAHGARGAGPARHRRDGASRVGLHRPARLQRLRGDGPIAGPDRHGGPGPAEGPARDDRRPGRRLPPRDGPADGGRPPGGRPRQDGCDSGPAALAGPATGPRRGSAPRRKGLCLRRVVLGRRPSERNGEHEER